MSDFYDTTTSYDGLIREVEDAVNSRRQKSKKTRATSRIVLLLIGGPLSGLLVLLTLPWWPHLIVWGSLVLIYLIILIIISETSGSQLLYDTVYRNAIELYNYNHDETFSFEFKPKLSKDFNIDMGLFTSWASITGKYKMVASLESGSIPIIQLCNMVTSNGKSQTTHFHGVYIILPKRGIPTQQIRTNGRPHKKGVKFDRLDEYEERAYLPRETNESRIHPVLLQLFHDLPENFDLKQHYVGSNESEVHLALWFRKNPKMPKEITYQSLEEVVQPLHDLMNFTINATHLLEETIL